MIAAPLQALRASHSFFAKVHVHHLAVRVFVALRIITEGYEETCCSLSVLPGVSLHLMPPESEVSHDRAKPIVVTR